MLEPRMTASRMFYNANKFRDAYQIAMEPLCEEAGLPQTAVDILLFLANNPDYDTARDICRCRSLKPGLVSFHVDRLVVEGLLERREVPGDRRKTRLVPTDKAAGIIEQGRLLQKAFAARLLVGLSQEDLDHFSRCLAAFDRNIESIRKNGLPGPLERSEEIK